MSWYRRKQLLALAGPLVIGTHVELTKELQRAGFSVMTIDVSQPLSPERLQLLLNRRILPVASRPPRTALGIHSA